MTIRSMTGFGFHQVKTKEIQLSIQVRSVNHRFFEWKPRIPMVYQSIEDKLKRESQSRVARGVLEVFIRREVSPSRQRDSERQWLKDAARSLKSFAEEVETPKAVVKERMMDWLLSYMELSHHDLSSELLKNEEELLMEGLVSALDALVLRREEEGKDLRDHCKELLRDFGVQLKKIKDLTPDLPKRWKESLEKRIQQFQQSVVSPERLQQEIVMMADRMDVTEEMARLDSHLRAFEKSLVVGGPQGKRLDFLIQEILREVNTTGSKIGDADAGMAVIQLKTLTEQLREQVQNIE